MRKNRKMPLREQLALLTVLALKKKATEAKKNG